MKVKHTSQTSFIIIKRPTKSRRTTNFCFRRKYASLLANISHFPTLWRYKTFLPALAILLLLLLFGQRENSSEESAKKTTTRAREREKKKENPRSEYIYNPRGFSRQFFDFLFPQLAMSWFRALRGPSRRRILRLSSRRLSFLSYSFFRRCAAREAGRRRRKTS